jgi:hypothetical protein
VDFTVGDAPPPPLVPTLSLAKAVVKTSEPVTVTWADMPGGARDWVGIYKVGQKPGSVGSTRWQYLGAAAGTASFSGLAPGRYYATVLLNDGYEEIVPRVRFEVVRAGDLNGDGLVDERDRRRLRSALGSCFGDARYVIEANFDDDSCITQNDYRLWYAIFRRP